MHSSPYLHELRIALITIISLIGENCSRCVAAAEAEDGGGLAGSWWRGWANVRLLSFNLLEMCFIARLF